MGRRMRKGLLGLMILAGAFSVKMQTVHAQLREIQIEQAQICMPDISLFLTGDASLQELDSQKVKVNMGEQEFAVSSVRDFDRNQDRTDYYFLLDVSGSMQYEYYQAACEAITNRIETLTDCETYKVLTFGDSVNVVLEDEYDGDKIREAFNVVSAGDDNTQLFEALKKSAILAQQRSDQSSVRKVAVVFTDGMDDVTGKATVTEATEEITRAGMTVYAVADGEDTDAINRFGEFVRDTGGQLEICYGASSQEEAQDIWDTIENTKVILAQGDSNRITDQIETVTVQIEQWGMKKEKQTGCYDYIPDREAPCVLECRQINENEIEVAFSEDVVEKETASNYCLSGEEKCIPDSVMVLDDRSVQLYFEEPLYSGEYSLEIVNITDDSMEENSVVPYEESITVEGIKPEAGWMHFLRSWGIPLLCVLFVLAVIITAIFLYRYIRKNRGLLVIDGKMTPASRVDIQQHIAVEDDGRPGALVVLEMKTGNGRKKTAAKKLSDSMIIGRSGVCDICIDDERMSKQHFALEYQRGQIYITDLETTNGTSVNGVRLHGRYRLEKGDRIQAGSMDMTVQWENVR